MNKIIPHLWFDNQAREAAAFYASVFPESKLNSSSTIHNTPSGDCDIINFEIWNTPFMAISAGPYFKPNPSINFIVNFDPLFFGNDRSAVRDKARAKLDEVWNKLLPGGKVLMPLEKYFFSERYGWIQDKYGFSWQLILTQPDRARRPTIIPSMMFIGANAGRADEAVHFYTSVFKNSERGMEHRYDGKTPPDKAGTLAFVDFKLEGQWFAALDSAHKHEFQFNEAVSLLISCENQQEIDYYWNKLSAVPEAEQCGWLKDKFGVSWQVNSAEMNEMMSKGTPEQVDRLVQSFLQMKKFDLAKLKKAFF